MTHQIFSPRKGVTIAYHRTAETSKSLPGVIFLGGFRSDMTGTKATFLEEQCKKRNQSYLRFDYTGHGISSGRFEDGTIGAWLQDARDAFDYLTEGMQIVIGSSMGGWLALLLALERQERVAGLIGLAAAPDFSEDIYHHEFSEEHRRHLAQKGVVYMPNDYADPHPLTKNLFDEAKNHLLLHAKIPLAAPVRLIHGKKDRDVPWQKSEKTLAQLVSADKKALWVEDGDHRLSRPQDLALIDQTLVELSHGHQLQRAGNG